MNIQHHAEELTLEGTASTINGIPCFEITMDRDHADRRDIWIAELVSLQCDGLTLSRDDCIKVCGQASIEAIEEAQGETYTL